MSAFQQQRSLLSGLWAQFECFSTTALAVMTTNACRPCRGRAGNRQVQHALDGREWGQCFVCQLVVGVSAWSGRVDIFLPVDIFPAWCCGFVRHLNTTMPYSCADELVPTCIVSTNTSRAWVVDEERGDTDLITQPPNPQWFVFQLPIRRSGFISTNSGSDCVCA